MIQFRKLFRWKRKQTVQRVRICIECGMPVEQHKSWCSILRTLKEQPALARSEK